MQILVCDRCGRDERDCRINAGDKSSNLPPSSVQRKDLCDKCLAIVAYFLAAEGTKGAKP